MIEFQYFDGCPNAALTLEHLNEALKSINMSEASLVLTEVPSPEMAEQLHFQGSPTILIDGIDIYTGRKPDSTNYTCRIYSFSGEKTGIIPKTFIEAALRKNVRSDS
jgi:hypothetical protein